MNSATSKNSMAGIDKLAASSAATDSRRPGSLFSRRMWYLVGVAAALAVVGLILALRGREPKAASADMPRIEKSWYTTDDGKTWFADDKRRLPPFDHNGKLAVRCWVYTCDNGKTTFAAYLERFEPSAKQKLEALTSAKPPASAAAPGEIEQLLTSGVEVKKPGAQAWIAAASPAAIAIREPVCPSDPARKPQLFVAPSNP